MRLPRRRFLGLAAGAAVLPTVSRIARAQAYPTRPVRIIAGYPPGGDASSRSVRTSLDLHNILNGEPVEPSDKKWAVLIVADAPKGLRKVAK
jgi:hypothetical protein